MESSTIATLTVTLVGVLTPAFVAVISHPIWSPAQKRVIAVVGAVILGALTVVGNTVWTDWQPTIPNVVTMILAVIGASQTAYALLWKPTGAADALETKINPGEPVIPRDPATGDLVDPIKEVAGP